MSPDEAYHKLEALRSATGNLFGLTTKHHRAKSVLEKHKQFTSIIDCLVRWNPGTLADMPRPDAPTTYDNVPGDPRVSSSDLEDLYRDMNYWVDIVHRLRTKLDRPTLDLQREGLLVGGERFDALALITTIFAAASIEILIVDPYFDQSALQLLASKKAGVAARVIIDKSPATLLPLLQGFAQQYGPFAARKSNAFHDRFICIDNREYFHLGTSLNSAGTAKAFMFSRIEEGFVIQKLKDTLAAEWAVAAVLV